MSAYEESVKKATKSKAVPPKRKHVRNIILESWQECGGAGFFAEIFRRPLDSNDTVCWKGLVTIHHILQEGHPKTLEDAHYRNSVFETLRSTWTRNGSTSSKGYGELIQLYATFLLEKINFHHSHREFVGDFNLDKFLTTPESKNVDKSLNSVTHMLELQQSICKIGKRLFDQRDMIDCKTACLIPLVVESYNIYTIEVHLIRKLVDEVDSMDVLTYLIEQFYAQYITLRNFFYDCSGVKYVTSVIAVPTLPKDPPEFLAMRRKKRPEPKPEPVPQVQQRAAPPPVVQQPPPQPQVNFFDIPPMQQQPPNPFASNPFGNPFAPVVNPPSGWVTFGGNDNVFSTPAPAPQPQVVQRDFSDLVSMVRQRTEEELEKKRREDEIRRKEAEDRRRRELEQKAQEDAERQRKLEEERRRQEAKRREEEQKRREEEERRRREAEHKRLEEERKKREEQRLREEQERIRKIAQEETSNEIRDLKMRIVELERLLAIEREKNKVATKEIEELKQALDALRRELQVQKDRSVELSKDIEQKDIIITQLSTQNKLLRDEYDSVTIQLDTALREAQEEKQRIIDSEIDAVFDLVNQALAKLDSPTNLGNDNATVQDVEDDTTQVADIMASLITAASTGQRQALLTSLRAISAAAGTLFSDAKGASRKVDDPDARQRLLDGVRATGAALAHLLGTVRNVGGIAQDDNARGQLNQASEALSRQLQALLAAARAAGQIVDEGITDESGADLESLAEQELLAAARVIEQAAAALLASQQQPKPEHVVPGVADAILEAAMAITKATSLLVAAAAAAQKERVEQGKLAVASGRPYKRDPRWSQGLISAAKAVAGATQTLISTANDVAQGKIEEENVIAASKGVAAATAQLVAATRAKADDPNSPAQLKIGLASRAVTAATMQLVEAAKVAQARKEPAVYPEDEITSGIQKKIKEMELQTHILKLEKELQTVRNRLFDIRRQEYSDPAASGGQANGTTK